jgi:uncharacterized protein YegP (UPF0339 family)
MNDLNWEFFIKAGKWHWKASYKNGETAAKSESGFTTKSRCVNEASSFGYKQMTEQFLAEA